MHYFPDHEAFERHKLERGNSEGGRGEGNERVFFGNPARYPCIGIEDSVEVGGGVFHVYMVDFAYTAGGGDVGPQDR